MNRAFLSLLCGLALTAEALAQTASDPNEGTRLVQDGPNSYAFSFWSRAGRYYFLQFSEDLVTWTYLPDGYVEGADVPYSYNFSVSGPDRFFIRAKYLESYTGDPLSQDFDGDKVTVFDELGDGTDPFGTFADSDGDGMPDDWETHFGLLPHNPTDAAADADGDGISNLTEYQTGPLGTDPTDYYNGTNYPAIQAIGWPVPGPTDEPGTLLPQPIVVEVKNGAVPLNNVRVTFFTQGSDAGQVSPTSDGAGLATILHLQTGPDGRVQVYFKHPSANPPYPTGRYIGAKVGSALPTGNGPAVSVNAYTQADYPYPPNTVGRSARDAIDSRIAGKNRADALSVFSIQHHGLPFTPDVLYVRNTASWCYDLRQQMTCISPYYSHGGIQYGFTAITPQHVITSAHIDVTSLLNVGDTVRFIPADNPTTVITKTIRGKVRHPNYGVGGVFNPDFTVCTLDSPLPATITPCKMLPANYASYLGYLENGRPPAMVLNQFEEASVAELRDLGTFPYLFATFTPPALHRKRLEFYNGFISGDSGNPAFLIIKPPDTGLDTLVLLTTWTSTGGGDARGTFTTPQISFLNEMIADADADATNRRPDLPPINTGLQVQTIDLSGFNTYSPP